MKLQNTEMANRLNTDTQTKKARATSPACVPPGSNSAWKATRFATKKA